MSTQEEGEKAEKTASGPKKPVFSEPSYPEGDVYFVETFTDAKKVWKRFEILELSKLLYMYIQVLCTTTFSLGLILYSRIYWRE